MTPEKGSKYREFYDLSGRITCMQGMIDRQYEQTDERQNKTKQLVTHIKIVSLIIIKVY